MRQPSSLGPWVHVHRVPANGRLRESLPGQQCGDGQCQRAVGGERRRRKEAVVLTVDQSGIEIGAGEGVVQHQAPQERNIGLYAYALNLTQGLHHPCAGVGRATMSLTIIGS